MLSAWVCNLTDPCFVLYLQNLLLFHKYAILTATMNLIALTKVLFQQDKKTIRS